jgi:hypothetical protein
MKKGEIIFNNKNNISCTNVPFKTVMWNYLCWVLGGRPNNWRVKCSLRKK